MAQIKANEALLRHYKPGILIIYMVFLATQ